MIFISVDPSTTTWGIATWDINDDLTINGITSFTLTVPTDYYIETRINRAHILLTRLMEETLPYQLVHESGFLDRFRPMAFGPLSAAIFGLRNIFKNLYGLNNDTGIFQYPPKTVKASVGKGTANKDDMETAVYSIKELNPYLTGNESEHAIDAIAIGYTHLKNIREYPEILLL